MVKQKVHIEIVYNTIDFDYSVSDAVYYHSVKIRNEKVHIIYKEKRDYSKYDKRRVF